MKYHILELLWHLFTCISLCKTFPGSLNVPFLFWCERIHVAAFSIALSSMKMYGLACTNDLRTKAVNLKSYF